VFISIEGPDGAGKTTQAALLVDRLREGGRRVVAVHEPGGTDLGTHIRALLVHRGGVSIDPRAEALLFSACRAQLVAEVIRPALESGAIVVADRFADSTRAYQGAGRGLPAEDLEALISVATGGLAPDLTVLLDLPPAAGLRRLAASTKAAADGPSQFSFFEELHLPAAWNRFEDEGRQFQERVRAAYLDLARAEPDRWRVVDATLGVADVGERVLQLVMDALATRTSPSKR